jgi:hypothetical protein
MRSDRFPTRLDVENKPQGCGCRRATRQKRAVRNHFNNTEFGQEAAARGARLRELR